MKLRIETNVQINKHLDVLAATGLFGNGTREEAAARILEQWIFNNIHSIQGVKIQVPEVDE